MFNRCSSLEQLNLSNFNTNNVINMVGMFSNCSSLKELDVSNFYINNETHLTNMFSYCKSLKELNLSNFKTDKRDISTYGIFYKCSEELIKKIKSRYKNFKKESFNTINTFLNKKKL